MVGLQLLKYLENLSDEKLVVQFKRNPYYQAFCGLTEFSLDLVWIYLVIVPNWFISENGLAKKVSRKYFR